MHASKKKYRIEMNYKVLIGKTIEETHQILYNRGFRKNEEGMHVRKTSLFSTTKLEIYSENNITLMITIHDKIMSIFSSETMVI